MISIYYFYIIFIISSPLFTTLMRISIDENISNFVPCIPFLLNYINYACTIYNRKLNPWTESFAGLFQCQAKYFMTCPRLEKSILKSSIQFSFINRKMRRIVLCILFVLLLSNLSESSPINRRTFEVPSLMEIVARKMGIVDFFSNFVKGIRAVFGQNSR